MAVASSKTHAGGNGCAITSWSWALAPRASAVETLQNNGANPTQVVIIDSRPSAITDANLRGYAAIEGDATDETSCVGPRS